MVLRDGFAERGERAETGDEKWLRDAQGVTSQAIPATKIGQASKKTAAALRVTWGAGWRHAAVAAWP